MAAILQTLSGNPLATPIGQKIEQATNASLTTENWSLNMEICDMINDTDEGPKDAARAIKRRLQQNAGKNHIVVMYTLTLLETCVKNCGKRFHLLVTSKDFAQDLVKLIGPRNDPPLALQEKVLNLIQSWYDSFRNQPDYSGIVQVYNELKSKGIEFPSSNVDSTAPIYTFQRSSSSGNRGFLISDPSTNHQNVISNLKRLPNVSQVAFNSSNLLSPIILNGEQLIKLGSDIEIVNGNIKVFSEMLNEMIPGKEHEDDWKLLKDLNSTCQAMQKRIVDLIEKIANEEITNDLLRVNDELNYLFERFERYERKKIHSLNSKTTSNQETSLLDLNVDTPSTMTADLPNHLQSLNIANNAKQTSTSAVKDLLSGGDADFDMFAQSRFSNIGTGSAPNSGNTAATVDMEFLTPKVKEENSTNFVKIDDINPTQIDNERDLNEMEKWLLDQAACGPPVSSSNFDQFLPKCTSETQAVSDQPNQAKIDEKKPKVDPFGS